MPDAGSSRPDSRASGHGKALHRTEILVGTEGLSRLAAGRVILFGVGDVGSWCAEALVRSGLGHLTLVDPDVICPTNLNRQLQALCTNLGESKVEALRARLLDIRPDADVLAVAQTYSLATRDTFNLASYPMVVDAIDSLSNKVGLIQHASELGCRVYSSVGASRKRDPARIQVASLWKSERDPLARFARKRLRWRGFGGEVTCVYSEEQAADSLHVADPGHPAEGTLRGSLVTVTATFGMILANLVISDLLKDAAPG